MHLYTKKIISLYSENTDPDKAFWAEKYMRNQYAFFGITSPRRKELTKEFFAANGLPPAEDLFQIVTELWNSDQRELQYFGMQLIEKFKKSWDTSTIELLEFIIVNKSWWDTVDFIAANLVGVYFRKFPEQIPQVTNKWMNSGNIWLQRSCVLFQLKYKKDTNTDLLFTFCEDLKDSNEFFIRKAIGWALREYSKTNPDAVMAFVDEVQLKPLSVREATRIVLKKSK